MHCNCIVGKPCYWWSLVKSMHSVKMQFSSCVGLWWPVQAHVEDKIYFLMIIAYCIGWCGYFLLTNPNGIWRRCNRKKVFRTTYLTQLLYYATLYYTYIGQWSLMASGCCFTKSIIIFAFMVLLFTSFPLHNRKTQHCTI